MAREQSGHTESTRLFPTADADLWFVQQVIAGDTEAFKPLWEKYERPVYQFFLHRVNDRHDAEDLASDTMLAVLQSIPRFRGASPEGDSDRVEASCSFRTFIHSIARHKLSHWLRRKRFHSPLHVEDLLLSPQGEEEKEPGSLQPAFPSQVSPNPLQKLLDAEKIEAVRYVVATLSSPNQFKVVFLHYLGGLTHQDIATLLALRSETVNSRLQDGRKSFQQCYERMEKLFLEV